MSNSVTLIGNLVEDPELRFTPSGVPMARIRLAVNERYRDRSGEWVENTNFFSGTLWRDQAENAAQSLTKGARVIVFGRLSQRSWENEQGERRSTIEIAIDEIGPSLRWATASVSRTTSGNGGGSAPRIQREEAGDDAFSPVEDDAEAPF